MYKFSKRCLFPCNVPIRYALMYAIQSAAYLPSPEWLKRFAKMDMDEAQSLWEVIFVPSSCTILHIDAIFFDGSRVSSGRNNKRYFISNGNFELPPSKKQTVESTTKSAYGYILDTLQEHSNSSQSSKDPPKYFDNDYIPLTGNEPTLTMSMNDCVLDTELRCPDTLDEMMLLVRQCRTKSRDVMQEALIHNEQRYSTSSLSQSSCVTPDIQSKVMPSIDISKYSKSRKC